MSEDYKEFNQAFAKVLRYWRYPRAAQNIRNLRVSAYDIWRIGGSAYFSTLKGKKITPEDVILLQEAFEQGVSGINVLRTLRRPDLEERVVAHPRDARERSSSEGRMTHRYYGPRTGREA